MQTTSDNEFDAFFREKLGSFESKPSDAVWERIAGELGPGRKKRRQARVWWAAASVVCLITCSYWLMRPAERIKLRGEVAKHQPSLATAKPHEAVPAAVVSGAEARGSMLMESKARSSESHPAAHVRAQSQTGKGTAEVNVALAKKDEPVLLPEGALPAVNPHVEEQRPVQTPAPVVLAMSTDERHSGVEQGQQEERQHNGIRSVGDLVNFVVAKVDKRKDKIIEFTEDEEGSLISGINLGVLKIRTKGEKRN